MRKEKQYEKIETNLLHCAHCVQCIDDKRFGSNKGFHIYIYKYGNAAFGIDTEDKHGKLCDSSGRTVKQHLQVCGCSRKIY